MKRIISLLTLILLLAAPGIGSMSLSAAEDTYTYTTGDGTWTGGVGIERLYQSIDFSFLHKKNNSSSVIAITYPELRVYASHSMEVYPTIDGKIITAIEVTCSNASYATAMSNAAILAGTSSSTATTITGISSSSGSVATFDLSGVAGCEYVKFTLAAQSRTLSWKITYSTGGNPLAAAPTFDPAAGLYTSPQDVTIATTTPAATIYYTTDGSAPDNTDTEYINPISVSSTTTIKAIAYADGFDPSGISTAEYTFPIEVADIAALRAGATDGTIYQLTGEAVLTYQTANRNTKYMQDATGAILIDDVVGVITTSYDIYDGITGITGTLGTYNGMLQFTPTSDPGVAASTGNSVSPVEVTLTDLTTEHQAKLVKVLNTTITETGNFVASTNYTISDDSRGTGILRTAYSDLDYIGDPIPEIPQDITGVVLQFDTDLQLVARSATDFVTSAIPWPVTFYVDMSNTPAFTTLEVVGDFNGWAGDAMTLVSENIYTFATAAIFAVDDMVSFKFRTDGNTWEQEPNRTHTIVAGTNEYHAVWNVMVPAEITYANIQWPATGEIEVGGDFDVYARVYANGLTGEQGDVPNLQAWVGYSSTDTDPATWADWVSASFNTDVGNNEEYKATIGASIPEPGVYYYASRFKLGLDEYVYGGYTEGGGGFWDGITNVSGELTINASEPSAHATGFEATANSSSAITVMWTDSDASGYLIKGSEGSFEAITAPDDGVPEDDGLLVKNITSGVETFQFIGLTPNTPYYFRIFPYNGNGSVINYKTDGTIPQDMATTAEAPTLLLTENFDYAEGQLLTDNGWTAHSGAGTQPIDVVVPGLTFDGYAGSDIGGAASVDNNGEDVNRAFTAQTSGVLYVASIIKINANTTAGYFYHLGPNAIGSTFFSRVWINNTANGINITNTSTAPGSYLTVPESTSFLLVLKHNFTTHKTDMFILNSFSTTEPVTPDATIDETLAEIGSVALRQYNASQDILVDGIIVTTTWADLVGATPPASSTYTNTGNWSEAGNWSDGIPAATTNAIINGNVTINDIGECNDLTILPLGAVTVGATKNLIVHGNLLIKSDGTGTGSFIGATADYTITGTQTIQRYINGGGYHFVSVPITGTLTAGLFMNSYLYYFDAATIQDWVSVGDSPATAITNDQGYMIWYTGSNTTYEFTGGLISGNFPVSTPAAASVFNAPNYEGGYNLVPNPYPSAIDWDAASGFTESNLFETIWIFNRLTGNYGTYVRNAGGGTNAVSNIIPVGQSFFVQATTAGTGSMTINQAARTHSSNDLLKDGNLTAELLKLKVNANNFSDELIVQFSEGSSMAFEGNRDAQKLRSPGDAPQLYSLTPEGTELSINTIPFSNETIIIPVGFELAANENAVFNFTNLESFDPNITIFLEDLLSGEMIDVREQQVYTFMHDEGNEALRFRLHFKSVVGVDEQQLSAYQIWSYDSKVYISIPALTGDKALIQLIDAQGKVVYEGEHQLSNPEIINVRSNQQLLIARIITGTQVYTQKVFIR